MLIVTIPLSLMDGPEAGDYVEFGVERCLSLDCGGEDRPVEYAPETGGWVCVACGTYRDPSEPPC